MASLSAHIFIQNDCGRNPAVMVKGLRTTCFIITHRRENTKGLERLAIYSLFSISALFAACGASGEARQVEQFERADRAITAAPRR
jgi:hypothetical protein